MAHSLYGSITLSAQFHSTSKHLSPFWQQFKNSVSLKIGPLHSQPPFHFHSISVFPSDCLVYQNHFMYLCSVHISPCCARLTGVIISVGVHLTIFKFSATLYDTVQSHSTINRHMYEVAMHSDVVKCVAPTGIKSHYRPLQRAKFPVLLPLLSNLLHEQQLNNWL